MKIKFVSFAFCLFLFVLLSACGIYSFTGSTLPSNVRTVEVPLFENRALVHGAAEQITDILSTRLQRERLTPVARNGDAIIRGVLVSYHNRASDFVGSRDDLVVLSSSVEIVADIVFFDQRNNREIYSGRIIAIGHYDFASETEEIGRNRAVNDLVDKILINSIRGW